MTRILDKMSRNDTSRSQSLRQAVAAGWIQRIEDGSIEKLSHHTFLKSVLLQVCWQLGPSPRTINQAISRMGNRNLRLLRLPAGNIDGWSAELRRKKGEKQPLYHMEYPIQAFKRALENANRQKEILDRLYSMRYPECHSKGESPAISGSNHIIHYQDDSPHTPSRYNRWCESTFRI